MKNKILLINTSQKLNERDIGIPYGLLSIGTILHKHGYDVKIVDSVIEEHYLNMIEDNLSDEYLCVGISTMSSGIPSAIQCASRVRKLKKDIPIVWGGIHPTLFAGECISDELVDVVCIGEGEYTMLELLNAFKSGGSLNSVNGICFKQDERPVYTKKQDFLDVNKFPYINYELLDMKKYILRDVSQYSGKKELVKVMVVNTGRGCPYKCTFCINTHPTQKFRPMSSEKLLIEVDRVVKKYDPDIIYFQDDIFFADENRIKTFFEEYEKRKYRFKWFALARANYFTDNYINNEFIEKIKGSCMWLGFGVESASARMLEKLRKCISLEQVNKAAKLLSMHNMKAGYSFMVGLPSETIDDTILTVKYILQLKKIHPQATFAYQYFRPYPGSELYNESISQGFRAPKSLREWEHALDKNTGYLTFRNLPWLKNYEMIDYLSNYAIWHLTKRNAASLRNLNIIKYIFFKISLNIRLRFNWWSCYWELKFIRLVKRLKDTVL